MTANIKTTDGQAFAAYARKGAWHILGQVFQDTTLSAEKVLDLAHLSGWNVEKYPLFAPVEGDGFKLDLSVPDRFGTVMTDPVSGEKRVLGDVGSRYVPIQNEEHADFLNLVVDESGGYFETAGALGRGNRVFVSIRIPEGITVGGKEGDQIDLYIGALNAHDASMPFTMVTTPIRWECQNMINFSLRRAANKFTVRHTGSGLKGQAAEARRALDLVFAYQEAFQEEANRLIDTTMTEMQFMDLIAEAYGPKEDSGLAAQTRAEERVGQMATLFTEAGTNANIRDTAWAGFNAITEYFDWFSATRSEDPETTRAIKSLDGEWATSAFNLVNEFTLA
jgi:phage/plasmid-like protein (TIGR03299 family)